MDINKARKVSFLDNLNNFKNLDFFWYYKSLRFIRCLDCTQAIPLTEG